MKINSFIVSGLLFTNLLFNGCSGGYGNVPKVTGQFIDDPVQGLNYVCSSGPKGLTNQNGEYTCNIGDDVTFLIGSLIIGTVPAQTAPITPYVLFPSNSNAAINVARLLQTLDTDPSDAIIIIDTIREAFVPSNTDFASITFEEDTQIALGIPLVSASTAKTRMDEVIVAAGETVPSSTNNIPVANAGVDQNVNTTSVVTLDGSASSDFNIGDTLTYSWSIVAVPPESSAALSDATAVKPMFTADKDGSYVFQLIVNDGVINSAVDLIVVTAATSNSAPVANAGVDQNVNTTSAVTLDGSASSDVNTGDTLTYSWSIVAIPAGSSAALSDLTAVKPMFTTDKDGSYVLQLIVNDGVLNSVPDLIVVTAATSNSAPVANAGADQNVNTTSAVTLDGTESSDADIGDMLTYSWSTVAVPAGSAAALSDPTAAKPMFVADKDGSYVFQLIVNDGALNSTADLIVVTAATSNSAPVANAGVDQSVSANTTVILDGTASSDANIGNTLAYSWSTIAIPAGSASILSNATIVNPTFVADKNGSYVFQLIVNDGTVNSVPDLVVVTAN